MSATPVVSSVRLGPLQSERLRDYELRVVDFAHASRRDLSEALHDAHGLLIDSHLTADSALLDLAPHLRALSTISVGLDHIDLAGASQRAITVTHTPVLSDAVADLTLALILITTRRLGEAIDTVTNGSWDVAQLGTDLRSKTLLIVGLGRIGREVARRALGFKMHVGGYDARPEVPEIAGVERLTSLTHGLARADIVSLHVDLNPTTRHLIDDAALAAMKPTAFLINTSRGGVVDQTALTRALVEHRLAGAGLDVLETEPPGTGEPLLAMPNVVVLPHIGSATVETRHAMLNCAVDNLAACLRGEQCPHTVALASPPTSAHNAPIISDRAYKEQ
jgi:lactate dehydrogenase-like 2-hydroxyacid dehydrogenase